MAKSSGYINAEEALNALAKGFDRDPDKASGRVRINFDGIDSLKEQKRLLRVLGEAEQSGAIKIRYDKHSRKVVALYCTNSTALFEYLERRRAPEQVDKQLAKLPPELCQHPTLSPVISIIRNSWARARTWERLNSTDEDLLVLRQVLQLSRHLLEHDGSDIDFRSFSMAAGCNSKALERQKRRVVKILLELGEVTEALDADSTLAQLGLEKIPQPINIGGTISVANQNLRSLPYIGIPGAWTSAITLPRTPEYVLFVENFVSFHRHCLECNDAAEGIILFTAGFPTNACQRAIQRIVELVPKGTPIFHWGDIDYGGIRILDFLTGLCTNAGVKLETHLMTPELADLKGEHTGRKGGTLDTLTSPQAVALGQYLSSKNHKILEQEKMSPVSPLD